MECAASLEGHVCFTAEIALPPTALDFNMGVIDFHFDGGMEIHIPVGVSPVDALAALRASSCANPDVVPPLTDAVPPLPAGMFVAPAPNATLPHMLCTESPIVLDSMCDSPYFVSDYYRQSNGYEHSGKYPFVLHPNPSFPSIAYDSNVSHANPCPTHLFRHARPALSLLHWPGVTIIQSGRGHHSTRPLRTRLLTCFVRNFTINHVCTQVYKFRIFLQV